MKKAEWERTSLFSAISCVTFHAMNLPDDPEGRRAFGEALKSRPEFESLLSLIDALTGERGCPWDQKRQLSDCPKYLQGELNEVVEALESGNNANLEEELGDLLFMVAFAIKLGEKEGRLSVDGVLRKVLEKMVYRHPHVFGGEMTAETADQVLANWKELKRREKEQE